MNDLWMFPGQGSQQPGMAEGLMRISRQARDMLAQAERVAGVALEVPRRSGPIDALRDPLVLEPLLTAVNLSYAMTLIDSGRSPTSVAGYSAGETAAYCVAGVLTLDDALHVSAVRGRHLRNAVDQDASLAAVTGNIVELEQAIDITSLPVEIAGFNARDQLTIVGPSNAVQEFINVHRAHIQSVEWVPVAGPWHSHSLDQVARAVLADLQCVSFARPRIPLWTSYSGSMKTDPNKLRHDLAMQIAAPVRWTHILSDVRSRGCEQFMECGSGRVLFGLVRRHFDDHDSYELRSTEGHACRITKWLKDAAFPSYPLNSKCEQNPWNAT